MWALALCKKYLHTPPHHASNLWHIATVLDGVRPTMSDVGGIKHNKRLFANAALRKSPREKRRFWRSNWWKGQQDKVCNRAEEREGLERKSEIQEHTSSNSQGRRQALFNNLSFLLGYEWVDQRLWTRDCLTFHIALEHVIFLKYYS